MKLTLLILALALLPGCSLIPKNVEFFQKKVKAVPELSPAAVEVQREAAALAKQRAEDTVVAAIKENASTNVVVPASDTAKLADAVSGSLGPPLHPQTDALKTVSLLNSKIAVLSKQLDAYREANEKLEGKKIEGTGLLQIPYFIYVGLVALVVVVGWHLAKLALTAASAANPGAAVGLAGMNVAGSVVARGFHQLVNGGEAFKAWVEKEINDPNVKKSVLDAFHIFHKQAQDQDVKVLVGQVKK